MPYWTYRFQMDRSYNFTCFSSFVSPLVKNFSQNWHISFFQIFCTKLGNYRYLKVLEPDFCGKIPFCPNLGKNDPKIRYFASFFFFENYFDSWLSIANRLTKLLLWSYCPKCSWPIRMQDSLECNISSIAFGGRGLAFPKYKNNKFAISL